MRVFDFDRTLVDWYGAVARSYAKIRAQDLREAVGVASSSGWYWPHPVFSSNSHFEEGARVDQLASLRTLAEPTGTIFRVIGDAIKFYRHQDQFVAQAAAGKTILVTTGRESGQLLGFSGAILNTAVRRSSAGVPTRPRANLVYPRNVLATAAIVKFMDQSETRPTIAQYSGREGQHEVIDADHR